MPEPAYPDNTPDEVRFGVFKFHPGKLDLSRQNTRIHLPMQPARLLKLLLSRPGEVVTRDEIQRTLWTDGTTVDFDMAVNRCVRQIREVLGDDSDAPRYIKTIPRLGYCFIAAIGSGPGNMLTKSANIEAPTARPAEIRPFPLEVASETSSSRALSDRNTIPTEHRRKPRGAAWRLQPVAVVLACTLIALGIVQFLRLPPPTPRVEGYFQLTNDSYDKVIKTGDFARSIFADSSRVYFAVFTGAAKSEVAEVSQTGGDTSLLQNSLASPVLLDYSVSRSELLLSSGPGIGDTSLWIQPVPAGSARLVPEILAHGGCWSPDGELMVYASESSLYLASRSGANSQLLARFDPRRGQRTYWPRWSPDGQSIRFSLYDRSLHVNSLWEVSPRGSDPRRILSGEKAHQDRCCGSWTADGRYYVFVSSDAGRSDIWTVPTKPDVIAKLKQSAEPTPLTAGPLSYSAPEPSPDGKKIFVIGEARRGELVQYDSTSGNFEPLAAGVSASQADFSKDGRSLAFVDFHDGSLWQSRVDGTEKVQLSFRPLKIALPRWSPDGTRIAFSGHLPDELMAIYVLAGRGSTARKLVDEPNRDQTNPDWSSDGLKLVFCDTSRAEQTSLLKIFNFKTGETSVVTGSRGLQSPRWSPDNRYISALTADLNHLMLYDLVANEWAQLASFRMGYPNWSRDSKYIYLVNLANRPSICRVRVADHQIEPIIDMSHRQQFWTDDAWLGLTPDNAPLLSRDSSIQQIFALGWTAK